MRGWQKGSILQSGFDNKGRDCKNKVPRLISLTQLPAGQISVKTVIFSKLNHIPNSSPSAEAQHSEYKLLLLTRLKTDPSPELPTKHSFTIASR